MRAFDLDTFIHITTHREEREAARVDNLTPVPRQTLRTPSAAFAGPTAFPQYPQAYAQPCDQARPLNTRNEP